MDTRFRLLIPCLLLLAFTAPAQNNRMASLFVHGSTQGITNAGVLEQSNKVYFRSNVALPTLTSSRLLATDAAGNLTNLTQTSSQAAVLSDADIIRIAVDGAISSVYSNGVPILAGATNINFIQGTNSILRFTNVNGRIDVYVASVPGSGTGTQTPWAQHIDAAGYNLINVGGIRQGITNLSGTHPDWIPTNHGIFRYWITNDAMIHLVPPAGTDRGFIGLGFVYETNGTGRTITFSNAFKAIGNDGVLAGQSTNIFIFWGDGTNIFWASVAGSERVVDETVGNAGNGQTTVAYSKDDIRDYVQPGDTDYNGKADVLDASVTATAITASGTIGAATVNAMAFNATNSANVPTASAGDNDTSAASTAFVMGQLTNYYDYIWIPAGAMVPAAVNGASTNTYAPSGADGTTLDVYDFDDTTAETNFFLWTPPENWDQGTVKAKFHWTADAGTATQGVTWGLRLGSLRNDDAFGAVLGSAGQSTDAYIAANDYHVSNATGAITAGGTVALGTTLLGQVSRDPGGAGDSKTGDAKLLGVMIQYRKSTLNSTAW